MSWSLGEVRSLAIKAARGCGMPWGLAEEAGMAVAWLEARDLPGVEALALYLDDIEGEEYSGQFCPIAFGAQLSDRGNWQGAKPAQVRQPLLLSPFLALTTGCGSVTLDWNGQHLVVGAKSVDGVLSKPAMKTGLHTFELKACEAEQSCRTVPLRRVPSTRKAGIEILAKHAAKTYAPATEASRLKGAGAGTTDND